MSSDSSSLDLGVPRDLLHTISTIIQQIQDVADDLNTVIKNLERIHPSFLDSDSPANTSSNRLLSSASAPKGGLTTTISDMRQQMQEVADDLDIVLTNLARPLPPRPVSPNLEFARPNIDPEYFAQMVSKKRN